MSMDKSYGIARGWPSGGGQLVSTLAPYLGQVATATKFPDSSSSSTNKNTMSRTRHYARDNITSLQTVNPNFYINGGPGTEVAPGGAASITQAIEYPVGTFTQIKFSGSVTGAIANNAYVVSDATTVSIPKGAVFFVRTWFLGSAYGLFGSGNDSANGEAFAFAASGLSDQTMGGTITNSGSNLNYRPAAIIAMTTQPSVFIVGDSRSAGSADTYQNASGDLGEVARSIGPTLAYINGGTANASLSGWLGGTAALRLQISQYCSSVHVQIGINDLYGGAKTAAQLQTEQASFLALLGGRPVTLQTLPPVASSTDGWVTVANQTALVPQRIVYNNWVRTLPAGYLAYFEIADVVESSRDSGKWGAPPAGTVDGVHETPANYLAIQNAGVLNPLVYVH